MLLVAVISVDGYPFLTFSDQEVSPSVGRSTRELLVPCLGMEELFPVMWIFLKSLGVICLNR